MADYRLYSRNAAGELTGEVDDFSELKIVARFNALGTWLLNIPYASDQAALFALKGGIVLQRDSTTVFSGITNRLARKRSAKENTLTISGYDDCALLAKRLVYPQPLTGLPFSAEEFDVRTGIAETVIKEYVSYNAGPLALVDRQIAGLSIETDYARGTAITGRARLENLYEYIVALSAQGGGLGVRIVDLKFQVWQPSDRSASVIFSEDLDNMPDFDHVQGEPKANVIMAGGSGDGIARVFAERLDGSSVMDWGRIEGFLDQSQTSTVSELQIAADGELVNDAASVAVRLTAVDNPGMILFEDYWLGDTVAVILDDVRITAAVQEIEMTLGKDGFVAKPVLAAGKNAVNLLRLFKPQNLNARLGKLERS